MLQEPLGPPPTPLKIQWGWRTGGTKESHVKDSPICSVSWTELEKVKRKQGKYI